MSSIELEQWFEELRALPGCDPHSEDFLRVVLARCSMSLNVLVTGSLRGKIESWNCSHE